MYKNKSLKIIFSFATITTMLLTQKTFGMAENDNSWWRKIAQDFVQEMGDMADRIQRDIAANTKSTQAQLDDIQKEKAALRNLKSTMDNETYKEKMDELKETEKDLKKILKNRQTQQSKVEDVFMGWAQDTLKTWNKSIGKHLDAEIDRTNLILQTAITEDIKQQGSLEKMKEWFKGENLAKLGGAATLTVAGVALSYYCSTLGFNYFNSLIGKPKLIRESSKHDWKHGFKTFWTETILGKKPEEPKLEDVILPPDMAEKLKFLADDTRSTQENLLPYRHVLFYGMPGTGKTMFAKRLAKYSGMDYAIMSGADFGQFKNGEDITELHKLFDWAEHSNKGLLIFIDEADAFLRDRRVLSNQAKDLLNAFLSRTGASSDKFMLVFATNYEDELDPAALSRINKKIYFPLPALEERIKIINLYLNKYIRNEERIIKRDNTQIKLKIEIQENVNENFIKEIAQRLDGFSGREIEQMISELRMNVYNKGNGILTQEIFSDIATEKLKEHIHDTECAKQQRKRYEASLGQTQISMK